MLGADASGGRDLVDFAITLQGRVDDLHRAVDEIAAAVARVDRRMDATLARTAIVRYDAYEQAGGRQSASVALLDANRTGDRPQRDPGSRLRARVREGARPGEGVRRPLARGAAGGRARDGQITAESASRSRSVVSGESQRLPDHLVFR